MEQAEAAHAVRIQVCGTLRIERDGHAVDLEKIGGSKPIELLKFLIAYGAQNIATDFIISKLWAEADGDHAKNSFDGTLHRLRRILGSRDTLLLNSGMLSLNAKVCWLDLWAFEQLALHIAQTLQAETPSQETVADYAHTLLEIFRGPCFWLESELPWVYITQDKTRTKFQRTVLALGRILESRQQFHDAVALYMTALEYYPLSEEICLRLIETRIHQGLFAEALLTFRKFSHVLSDSLGLAPSNAMQQAISVVRGN